LRACALTLYDTIGQHYVAQRAADPRIAQAIRVALGEAVSVVNVGAGAGSYEPPDLAVCAVEPSPVMCAQRPRGSAPVVRAVAEHLPFAEGSADVVLAVLTVHHWTDPMAGLRECQRVARQRVVVLTWDPEATGFWLVEDYFPDLLAYDRRAFPPLARIQDALGGAEVRPLLVPNDCVDGFLGAYWQRPEAYLQAEVRAGMSSFARAANVAPGLARLHRELASGLWEAKYGALRTRAACDVGYRLVVGEVAKRVAA
jgi:SAM-dependent methyltransferase